MSNVLPYKNSGLRVSPTGIVYGAKGKRKLFKRKDGYVQLTTKCKEAKGGYAKFFVHRMVAELYVPNQDNKRYANHKDGDKANNHYDNLEWVTAAESTAHAVSSGLIYNLPTKGQQGFRCGND